MNRRGRRKKKKTGLLVAVIIIIVIIAAALIVKYGLGSPDDSGNENATQSSPSPSAEPSPTKQPDSPANSSSSPSPTPSPSATPEATPDAGSSADSGKDDDSLQVIAKPESVTVLVNKQNMLPEGYEPPDLVYPDVPFTFKDKIDKRKMRQVAADALEKLFAAADKDGAPLAGVSAYRSYSTQKVLFDNYVKRDGLEKARTYSALPGTSEHETGLAIDVTGSDGKCAASDCFGDEPQAKWLGEHAAEYGFIIRYPKGRDDITGYQYEPWHIRYVGTDISKIIAEKDITLEEYYEQYGNPEDGGKQVAVGK